MGKNTVYCLPPIYCCRQPWLINGATPVRALWFLGIGFFLPSAAIWPDAWKPSFWQIKVLVLVYVRCKWLVLFPFSW